VYDVACMLLLCVVVRVWLIDVPLFVVKCFVIVVRVTYQQQYNYCSVAKHINKNCLAFFFFAFRLGAGHLLSTNREIENKIIS
jgi:hypothetical protein